MNIVSTLRSVQPLHLARNSPLLPIPKHVRHRFWTLVRELKVDNTARPPYSQKAADKIRHLLEEWGLAETLLLDFELLLHVSEERAQKHREELGQREDVQFRDDPDQSGLKG
ncbi:hypothetical protein INS49_013608 [Diaporthe citri]|uniref:uncharacterized protein n=1 Tax=Diaporthe citri TaxID=83186 RepID=UPI001C7F1216|nr:uncharacterized protein INS49_013608 [Diaporthe citri]KAG6357729.1 hypothetical protein INS49_013608 [Diaporthe citri]